MDVEKIRADFLAHDFESRTFDCIVSAATLHRLPVEIAVSRMVTLLRPGSTRAVRDAWSRHGAGETYFTLAEAQALANRLLPGSRVYSHWLWRYTILWDKPCTV